MWLASISFTLIELTSNVNTLVFCRQPPPGEQLSRQKRGLIHLLSRGLLLFRTHFVPKLLRGKTWWCPPSRTSQTSFLSQPPTLSVSSGFSAAVLTCAKMVKPDHQGKVTINVPVQNDLVILKPTQVNVKKNTISVLCVLYFACIRVFEKK